MATNTLYKTAKTARKILFFAILITLVLTILNYVNINQNNQFELILPIGSNSFWAEPNNSLGSANSISIKEILTNIIPEENIKALFQLTGIETLTIPDSAFVYEIELPTRGLTTIMNAEEIALNLGFTRDNFITKETPITKACPQEICIWENPEKTRKLTYNILQGKWTLNTDFRADSIFQQNAEFNFFNLDTEKYYKEIIDVMNNIGFSTSYFSDFIENNVFNIFPININFSADFVYIPTQSNVIHSILRRYILLASPKEQLPKDVRLNNIYSPIYLPQYRNSHLKILSYVELSNQNIYEIEFIDRKYKTTNGIYSIINSKEAWTKITLGEGFLVDLSRKDNPLYTPKKNTKVVEFRADRSLTEIAYIEPYELNLNKKNLVIPIYIFRGVAFLEDGTQNDFVFYVNAIKTLF
ncbi:MAG: hypothetical protein NZZ41_06210 [Candidatus Dojkabacteria bacterium]|nr:hypothetical protein [Candidatus Dojkabacteria bacterium]